MTRAPSHLQLMRPADGTEDTGAGDTEPTLAPVVGAGPDDGRLAHPATRRRGTAPPSRHEAEALVVGFVADLVHAPEGAVGRVAAGVHEAAVLVVRGARDARPALGGGTVVLASSAHPAYFAAAATAGLHPLVVPVDADGRAPLGAMTAAVRPDTVLVVASAPSYTHGTVDPIGWLAAAAQAREVPLHVDASCGGWSMAYAEREGRVRPAWGFAVGGVASVTLDVGPESGVGSDLCVVLHREPGAARSLDVAARSRGPVELPAAWTRPGALLGDVVETLQEVGHDGCGDLAAQALGATAALVEGLLDVRGVQPAALPDATTISLRADATCDVLTVADGLHDRGWAAVAVLPEQGPPLLRLPVTPAMASRVDDVLAALGEAVDEARQRGRAQVDPHLARMLGTLDALDPREVADRSAHLLLDAAAALDGTDVGPRASTNHLLAAAGPGPRRALLAVQRERLGQRPATSASTTSSE